LGSILKSFNSLSLFTNCGTKLAMIWRNSWVRI